MEDKKSLRLKLSKMSAQIRKDIIAYFDNYDTPFTFRDVDKKEMLDDICVIIINGLEIRR